MYVSCWVNLLAVMALVFGVEIPTRCFVGGLPYSMTELELNTFFSQFGAVKDSKIITDRNGVSKGYGFVTYQTEQEAADVCAKRNLYYKEKKLNISKAIRRQGGQYGKPNQEYVNGQRMLYQSSEGYVMKEKNGCWVVEDPSPFCQPAKPCFQFLLPPPPPPAPVFMGGPSTLPYLQPPTTYYPTLSPAPSMSPYQPLPPDPGSLLYCDMIEPPLMTPLQMISHTHTSASIMAEKEQNEEATEEDDEERKEVMNSDSQTPTSSSEDTCTTTTTPTTPTTPSLSVDPLSIDLGSITL